jgi:triosephosphate isomerase
VKAALRRPLVVGNWKLYKTLAESRALAMGVCAQLGVGSAVQKKAEPGRGEPELALAPVFTALAAVREVLADSGLGLAAQDCYWEPQGAFTGEVSAVLLRDAGCGYVIVGHSERRQFFGEQDEHVRRKTAAVIEAGMIPIVCVGESLAQREAGQTESHVLGQVSRALEGLTPGAAAEVVIAYEPIWAIGTGRTAQPEDAQVVHARIRGLVAERFSDALAARTRILYGGSVKPDNARALMGQSDVDGALVGGASLDAASFAAIAAAARV